MRDVTNHKRYLSPGDPGSFKDLPVRDKPEGRLAGPGRDHQCPKCQGRGGWNLLVDAYGPGKHFRSHCLQCSGWGWVKERDAICVHDWDETRGKRMGQRFYTCKSCGAVRETNSI